MLSPRSHLHPIRDDVDAEVMHVVGAIVAASWRNGKFSLARLRHEIATALLEAQCRHCGARIRDADVMDSDPSVDRQQRRVNGVELTPAVWRAFELLYRHQRPISVYELEEAGLVPEAIGGAHESNSRTLIWLLRRSLRGSRFHVLSRQGGAGYQLRESDE